MDNQTTCKCDAFTLDKLLQAHCMSRLFPYPLLCLPLLDYIVSLSLEIMQAIISHHVFHPRVQVYGNSEFKSYFVFLALIFVQMLIHPRDRLRVVLSKKNVKYHIV